MAITNGGFETGDLTGWTVQSCEVYGSGAATAEINESILHTGSYSLHVGATGSEDSDALYVTIKSASFDTTGIDTLEFYINITEFQSDIIPLSIAVGIHPVGTSEYVKYATITQSVTDGWLKCTVSGMWYIDSPAEILIFLSAGG